MKKLMCALLSCALCACALTGCGKKDAPADSPDAANERRGSPEVTQVPEEGGHGEEDQSKALADMPTAIPAQTVAPQGQDGGESDDYYSMDALVNPSATPEFETYVEQEQPQSQNPGNVVVPDAYQYSALIDTSLGFTFNYPSNWENVPGVFTVCFREKVEPGDFPARVAISAKKLVHSPEGTVLSDELSAYMRMVYKQYEPDSFQVGVPNSEDTFMGKQAYSNTYLAYSGETEVKGFIIGRAVKRTLYVFHFCATYEDYAAMESLMRYMIKSVELVDEE